MPRGRRHNPARRGIARVRRWLFVTPWLVVLGSCAAVPGVRAAMLMPTMPRMAAMPSLPSLPSLTSALDLFDPPATAMPQGQTAQTTQTALVAPRTQPPSPVPMAAPMPAGRFQLSGAMMQGGAVIGTAPAGTTVLMLDGAPVPVAPDGRFVIGFDRDAGPAATLVATLDDGSQMAETLTVSPRGWRIERLDTLPKFPKPSAEMEQLRPAELAEINAARAIQSDAQGWRQPMLWPVTGRISGLFGSQRIYRGEPGSYHSGIDIARPEGTTVLAPADGVVILAADRPFTLEGNLLMIDHGMGLNSAFLHLSRIDVRPGERVKRGQPVGAIGMTGRATGPHLHWSLRWRAAKLDPLLVAGPMPVTQ